MNDSKDIASEELQGYGTFFDELWLLMIGFDRGQRVGQGISKKVKGKRRGAARGVRTQPRWPCHLQSSPFITAELWDAENGWN